MLSRQFIVGQRVVVLADNGYDQLCVSKTFGPMAGYYGHITRLYCGTGCSKADTFCGSCGCSDVHIYEVKISGHISGQISPGVLMSLGDSDDGCWPFFATELDAVD